MDVFRAKFVFVLISISRFCFSQAEMTPVYNDYYRINENSKKIKDAKIRKCTSLIITKDNTDTLDISYYDINGSLKSETKIVIVSNNADAKKLYQRYTFKYDENGRVLEKIDSTGDIVKRIVLSYEQDGTLSSEEVMNSRGEVIKDISHDYDELSRLIESTEKDREAKCKTVKKYAYDSYNNMAKYSLSSNCTDSLSKALDITYVYKYDNKSNIIEKNSYFSSKSFKTESFKYGANGKVSQSYVIMGNDNYTQSLYFYDNLNYLIKIEKTDVNGTVTKKSLVFYTNDKFGNVLEIRELSLTGVQYFLIKYEYEYY
jgi:hypothetical protein